MKPILLSVLLASPSLRFHYFVTPTAAKLCLGLPYGLSNVLNATLDY